MFTRRLFIKGLTALGIMAAGGDLPAHEPDHIAAHKHSSRHRQEVLSSGTCGCFFCLSVYAPDKIRDEEWIDDDESGMGQTARCPSCGIDSVIGSRSGYPVTQEFLSRMERHWFGCGLYSSDGCKRYTAK